MTNKSKFSKSKKFKSRFNNNKYNNSSICRAREAIKVTLNEVGTKAIRL